MGSEYDLIYHDIALRLSNSDQLVTFGVIYILNLDSVQAMNDDGVMLYCSRTLRNSAGGRCTEIYNWSCFPSIGCYYCHFKNYDITS